MERTLFGEFRVWTWKHSKSLTMGSITTVGLAYLWDIGHTFLATFSALAFGGVFVYCSIKSQIKVTSSQAIVITGCDSGLGYSFALYCKSLGAVVIAGVLEENGLGVQELLKKDIIVVSLDITKRESIRNFGSTVYMLTQQKNLTLRALINNAGVMIFGEFEWQTEEQIRHQVEVNLLGTMRVTRELLPLIRTNSSRIIVISSHCSGEPLPGVAVYGATKAALSAWSAALRVEMKKYGVDVVCFVPGSFTGDSNLLAQQDKNFEAMRVTMTEEAKLFYGNYFTRYSQYLSSLAHDTRPRKLENPFIYEVFQGALLDRYPLAIYMCEPWRYKFYYTLFKISPMFLRDQLVQRFMQMPTWKQEDCNKVSATGLGYGFTDTLGRLKGSNYSPRFDRVDQADLIILYGLFWLLLEQW